jgi:hypothetical protein
MNYTVEWLREAENQVMVLWLRSADKNAVTHYVDQLDKLLARNPLDHGESRSLGMRLAFFRPLCVRYHVDENAKKVTVMAIRWVGR